MKSNSPSKPQKGGGILRSTKFKSKSSSTNNNATNGVSFSSNVQTSTFQTTSNNDYHHDDDREEYDSDDDDAILASGDGLVASRLIDTASTGINDDDDDEVLYTAAEIEQAKRRRDASRHNADLFETSESIAATNNNNTSNNNNLSLITDDNANPDEYQSNAGSNASCPVEPFNMDSEREGGYGYFDGDTYVFRKAVKEDGEEDAWLDGLDNDDENDDENEESIMAAKSNVGGLNSMNIWKPDEKTTLNNKDGNKKRRPNKYVNDDMTQEEIGGRLISLLQADSETVMMALTRHGMTIRQLSLQEQKSKKHLIKKRKVKTTGGNSDESTGKKNAQDDNDDMNQLKIKIKEVRGVIEELTELADALLFKGETDAYELTKADWIHRFKLLHEKKRTSEEEAQENGAAKKKARRNYFADNNVAVYSTDTIQRNVEVQQQQQIVMWEYKGNEDGTIHGPYTTQQMLQWTTCGYFVGESAVDIRQVRDNSNREANEKDVVEDLMADLMDDEEEVQAATTAVVADNEWLRSDAVDFNSYL